MMRGARREATIAAISVLAATAMAPTVSTPFAVFAEEDAAPRIITFDFDEASLGLLVKFFVQITGKNIVLAEGVNGNETFTIVAEEKVSVDEAWQIFADELKEKGFETQTEGNDVTILRSSSKP